MDDVDVVCPCLFTKGSPPCPIRRFKFLSPDSCGNLVSRVLSLSRGKKENPGDEVAPTESLILTLILTFIFGKGGGGVFLPKQSPGLLALK